METSARTRWVLIVGFAIAMAWVEAASVYYLRTMVDRVQPYQSNPLPMTAVIEPVELVREAATLVMLLMAGALAGCTWATRLGYTAIAFGVWDIFYYAFLKIMTDWPASIFDWDVLFLLPLPWWGPVLAPVCIAVLMIVWGTLISQGSARHANRSAPWELWGLSWLGIALALGVFMADSIRALPQGLDATRNVLPHTFHWPLFSVAMALMATPVVYIAWRMRPSHREQEAL